MSAPRLSPDERERIGKPLMEKARALVEGFRAECVTAGVPAQDAKHVAALMLQAWTGTMVGQHIREHGLDCGTESAPIINDFIQAIAMGYELSRIAGVGEVTH